MLSKIKDTALARYSSNYLTELEKNLHYVFGIKYPKQLQAYHIWSFASLINSPFELIGQFGIVYKGLFTNKSYRDPQRVAVKTIPGTSITIFAYTYWYTIFSISSLWVLKFSYLIACNVSIHEKTVRFTIFPLWCIRFTLLALGDLNAIWKLQFSVLFYWLVSSTYDTILRWMPRELNDGKSQLVQLMAWCRQAASDYYPIQCLPNSVIIWRGATRGQGVNPWTTVNAWWEFSTMASDKICIVLD